MQNNNMHLLPQEIYAAHLKTINEVNFTHREIDIIAFIISGRSAKKIASFLSISPKTVENHTHNIMVKLKCNSRESIIDFIEKSGKFSFVKQYYTSTLSYTKFVKNLKIISTIKGKENPVCLIVYWQDQNSENSFIRHLEAHLNLAGVSVSLENRNGSQPLSHIPEEIHKGVFVIYVLSDREMEIVHKDLNMEIEKSPLPFHETVYYPKNILILFSGNENQSEILKNLTGFGYINLTEQRNYYFLVLEIIERLFSDPRILTIISELKEETDTSLPFFDPIHPPIHSKEKPLKENRKIHSTKTEAFLKNWKRHAMLALLITSLVISSFLVFKFKNGNEGKDQDQNQRNNPENLEKILARSDLIVPMESVSLSRPDLIIQIKDNFNKQQEGIRTVILMGIGGVGKTTLARQYARAQKSSVIWEINGETKESLIGSFENLAYVLSKTEKEKKTLRGILDIKTSHEREEKIILFVKKQLKYHPNWFLIYDNVEKFSEIQKYFPSDLNVWGEGNIIVTTRDSNIKNIAHINIYIQMGALNRKEKLNLFIKILNNVNVDELTTPQKEQAISFLNEIPPFPLDVSVAAYYLKITNIPYKKYLEYLKNCDKDFTETQESVLKEAGDYGKTRHSIITLSLKRIIDTHKDFGDLFLFISLLDSQDIPRVLLDNYKSDIIVDKFIHNLKKYSLITNNKSSSTHSISTFSIHRSTQETSLNYFSNILNFNKNTQSIKSISHTLEKYINEIIDQEDFVRMKILLNHYVSFLSHKKYLPENTIEIINGELGCIYLCLGNDKKAKEILNSSLTYLNKHFKGNHPLIPYFLRHLGNTYFDLGDYEKAKDLCEQSLKIYTKYFPKNHTDIAETLSSIAIIVRALGDYKKAKVLLEQSLEIYKKHPPENSIKTAQILKHSGYNYKDLGDYKKAKSLLEQSLEIYKNHLPERGDDDTYTWVQVGLGNLYRELGDYQKAKDLFEQSLIVYKNHLPENHHKIARILKYLGALYREWGDYEKSRELLEKSLVIYETYYPEDQLSIAWVLQYLGNVHRRLKDYQKAKGLIEKSVSIHKRLHGSNSINTNLSSLFLGNLHVDLGAYKEGRTILNKCLKNYEDHFGKDHIQCAIVLRYLARTYLKEGDLKTAEKILHKSLKLFQPTNHPHNYRVLEDFGVLHQNLSLQKMRSRHTEEFQTHRNQALIYMRQALKTARDHFPEGSPHIIRIQSKLKAIQNQELKHMDIE